MGSSSTVASSMATHEAEVKAKQSAARRASAPTPSSASKKPTKAKVPTVDPRLLALIKWRNGADAPEEVLDVVDTAIRRGTATPRTTVAKAEPKAVAEFFKSTGLSAKQIAEAVGVSSSVISTVQRENGDRWSQERFERAKPLILAAAKELGTKAP
jgi:hypothetical protein